MNRCLVPKGHTGLFRAVFLIGIIIGTVDAAAAQTSLPDAVARPLNTAIAEGDAATITAVARTMIKAYPEHEAAIRARLAEDSAEAAAKALAALTAPEANAAAPEAAPEPTEPRHAFFGFSGWTGEFELGGTLNTGNTEEKAIAAALALDREAGRWTHALTAAFDFTRTDGLTSKRRFIGNYELDYDLSRRSYAYGFVEYRDDRFGGYDYRIISSAGYGHHMIDRPDLGWQLKGGPGVRYNKRQDIPGTETEFVGRLSSEVEWQISETATFVNNLGVFTGTKTTTFDTLTALDLQINSRLSGRMSFETHTDTDPPEGAENTDTITKGSLLYHF